MNSTDSQQPPPSPQEQAPQEQAPEEHTPEEQAQAKQQAALGTLSRSYFSGLLELLKLESKQALAAIPALLLLGLLMLPLALLAWIGASVLVAYLAYSAHPSMALAITVFLLIQLLAIYLLKRRLETYVQRLKLPHSREEIGRALQLGLESLAPPANTGRDAPVQQAEPAASRPHQPSKPYQHS